MGLATSAEVPCGYLQKLTLTLIQYSDYYKIPQLKIQIVISELFKEMGGYHPNEPQWYLPLLGVDPLHHGKNLGPALLEHATNKFDKDNVLTYLEAANR